MRARTKLTAAEAAIVCSPHSIVEPLDFPALFGRTAPVEVDLGCGDGAFLVQLAQSFPDRDFLGVERMPGRVRSACHKAIRLPNVRVLRMGLSYAAQYLLRPNTVSAFYLLFPDPWPKRRHQGRRIVTVDLARAIHRALVPCGTWHIATDDQSYFDQIAQFTSADCLLTPSQVAVEFPATTFERKFRASGLPIYRLLLRKVCPVQCARATQPFSSTTMVTAPV